MSTSLSVRTNLTGQKIRNTLSHNIESLAKSTKRLATGLRITSSSDDAAGLAIRELMRAEIAANSQGIRNCMDAISLIQSTDGALGIIDEKLIRMRELAEQAASGTYNEAQRMMIDSEYQEMGSEIERIASANKWNGIQLTRTESDESSASIKKNTAGLLGSSGNVSAYRTDGKVASILDVSNISQRNGYSEPLAIQVNNTNIEAIKDGLKDGT